jgi:hypothetical protein
MDLETFINITSSISPIIEIQKDCNIKKDVFMRTKKPAWRPVFKLEDLSLTI